MPHELWPNRIFTVDQLPSRSRVSSLCRPLRRGPPTAGVLLLGSVSDDGLRSVDLPRKPSRYRGVPSLTAGETLPPGLRGHVSRSTLADANENRDWRIFADFRMPSPEDCFVSGTLNKRMS